MKMLKWKDAIASYQKFFDLTGNIDTLGQIASCYEEMNKLSSAVECYSMILVERPFSPKYILRKLRLLYKLSQF